MIASTASRRGDHLERAAGSARRAPTAIMSTGLPSAASAGRKLAQLGPHLVGQRRDLEAARLAGVGAQDPGPAGVGDDRRPACPPGSGWLASSDGDVEQLGQRVGADHARLLGTARRRSRRRRRAARPVCEEVARAPAAERPLLTATIGLVRPTRRAIRANLRGFPNDSRYSRITSVSVVGLPVVEQVVAGDVGLVADRHERREPEPELRAWSMIARPSAPLCERNPTRPGGGHAARRWRSAGRRGAVFRMPEAVGPDQPHADVAADREQLALALRALRPGLGEARPRSRPAPARPSPRSSRATSTTAGGRDARSRPGRPGPGRPRSTCRPAPTARRRRLG